MKEVDVHIGSFPPEITGRLGNVNGKHVFSYRHDAKEALSVTMPVRNESYQYTDLHPIFQMNLPEGALRSAIERMTAKQYGSDDLTMLTILGCHQIGRIAYSPPDQEPVSHVDDELSLQALLNHEDVGLFATLLQRYAQTSGVAGVQPKVLLDIKSRLTLPAERYIVKSWGEDYPQLACNEFVCMNMARDAGLEVPDFYLSDNAQLLISHRFDIDEQGKALGFEDFCVLQAKGTREKYDSSLEACTHTIRQFVSPEHVAQALYDFYKLTLLNVRIRNGDAHLKNSGILYSGLEGYQQGQMPDTPRKLAPIFDLVSTVPYLPRDTMALTLAGSKRWPKQKVLEVFGLGHCQLSKEQVKRAAEEVEFGVQANLGLLEGLQAKHEGFAGIAEKVFEVVNL
uniref:Type II toxin-antitoxin system HipA family toxin n=1 Tax=uncultured Thiotrichaceae bacterium TaxID=298394 RepID=A0A6S6UC11_9GAMM|nr:MAG: Type II toxin-antitoxin system HipA family toxin [uncultured Thiotrichaceae bacterium]